MRILPIVMRAPVMPVPMVLAPGLAAAHPGHLAEAAGHDHLLAGAAVGAAVLAGLWGAWKGRRGRDEARGEEPRGEAEPEG